MALPLEHLTVLDLTLHRAGPTCARQLADWGAKVIKIEVPGGPKGEATGANRLGPDYQNLHRNKLNMTLNLKTEEGRAIFLDLCKTADVVIENYRSDVKHRLRIDYDVVSKVNPRIIYGSISGFGQSGPDATRPGVDQIAQGMGGLMSITGEQGRGPMRVGIPIADLTAGLFLFQAVLLALMQREQTGVGQWVHTSLLEAMIFMLDFVLVIAAMRSCSALRFLERCAPVAYPGSVNNCGAPAASQSRLNNLSPEAAILMWPSEVG